MDLSKASDTINYELLTAKLHAYGFSKDSLKSYLSDRWQRTKINLSFSSWSELLQGATTSICFRTNFVQYIRKYRFLLFNV